MESLFTALGLAVVLFVSTNVDDLVLLIAFFANSSFRARDIVAGQYVGVAILFIVSVAGALLSLVIPKAYLGLLGIFPILIGIRKLLELRHDPAGTAPANVLGTATGEYGNIASVALVAIANGADNIGVYLPAFAVHPGSQIAIIALVFVAMTALWCLLAHRMVSHPRFGAPLRRYAHIFAPLVLIGLGILIIYNAGSIPSLFRRAGAAEGAVFVPARPADASLRQNRGLEQMAQPTEALY
jgi:cadmium resistance protein CadD (predicted permease)